MGKESRTRLNYYTFYHKNFTEFFFFFFFNFSYMKKIELRPRGNMLQLQEELLAAW
jgi:hypothetical protein